MRASLVPPFRATTARRKAGALGSGMAQHDTTGSFAGRAQVPVGGPPVGGLGGVADGPPVGGLGGVPVGPPVGGLGGVPVGPPGGRSDPPCLSVLSAAITASNIAASSRRYGTATTTVCGRPRSAVRRRF